MGGWVLKKHKNPESFFPWALGTSHLCFLKVYLDPTELTFLGASYHEFKTVGSLGSS